MRRTARYSFAVIVASTLLVGAAWGETWTLQLKRPGSDQGPTGGVSINGVPYLYWTSPQNFYSRVATAEKGAVIEDRSDSAVAFKRIVKKEPHYQSEHPFRGVAKLGDSEYAFALDAVGPKPAPKKSKPENPKAEAPPPQSKSLFTKLAESLFGSSNAADADVPKIEAYNRLYFDFNHNGDFTDDKIVEAAKNAAEDIEIRGFARIQFPNVNVMIDVGGAKLDYAFSLSGYVNALKEGTYVSLQLSSAVCREGDIVLEGKKRHVLLLDFNSNGCFDDQARINEDIRGVGGTLFPEQGDMLLIDAGSKDVIGSPYDVSASGGRHYVAKLANIDGRFYDLKVSPTGDTLTLNPSSVPLGSVKNPNGSYRAVIYGDKGFLDIEGKKDAPVPVPEGKWKLLSYTIDVSEPGKAAEKKSDNALSAWSVVAALLGGELPVGPSSCTQVSAEATRDYKPVTVRKGETIELPFGPPYTPKVAANNYGSPDVSSLSLSLVGSAGEICNNMIVSGHRPSKPEFTITDPKGEVVQTGSFEYG